jgi:hypothetical protein
MEEFKLEYFKNDFPNKKIKFKEIDEKKIDSIINNEDLKELLNVLNSKKNIIDYNLEDKNNFKELFFKSIKKNKDFIYVYNLNYDDLDSINVEDLKNYFDYIWYPSSDDFLLFDEEYMWVIWVCHSGITRIKTLTN